MKKARDITPLSVNYIEKNAYPNTAVPENERKHTKQVSHIMFNSLQSIPCTAVEADSKCSFTPMECNKKLPFLCTLLHEIVKC